MRVNIALIAVGIVLLAAGIGVGVTPRVAVLHDHASGQAVASVDCGSHYLPGSPATVTAFDGKRVTPTGGTFGELCGRQNPVVVTVLAWLASVVGVVLFAVGMALAAAGVSRQGRMRPTQR